MSKSRLTYKYQATVPKVVREALALGAGDEIEFVVSKDTAGRPEVRIRKGAKPGSLSELEALSELLAPEWDSPEDEDAFGEL